MSLDLKPYRLPDVPTTSARVLVAFAVTGFIPKRIRAGKVIRVPPPATAFIMPAPQPLRRRVMTSAGTILFKIGAKLLNGD